MEEIVELGATLEEAEPEPGEGRKTPRKRRFQPVVAARKSSRIHDNLQQAGGTNIISTNAFTILNSCDDDVLEMIENDCDVRLGANREEIRESLGAMKLEEQARAALAEASYKANIQGRLDSLHILEGENLELNTVTNNERGFVNNQKKGGKGKGKQAEASPHQR
jgi:uncharacterized membrane protein YdfJ with MMPL/SSD domain